MPPLPHAPAVTLTPPPPQTRIHTGASVSCSRLLLRSARDRFVTCTFVLVAIQNRQSDFLSSLDVRQLGKEEGNGMSDRQVLVVVFHKSTLVFI